MTTRAADFERGNAADYVAVPIEDDNLFITILYEVYDQYQEELMTEDIDKLSAKWV